MHCSRPAKRLFAKTSVNKIRHMKYSLGEDTYRWLWRDLDWTWTPDLDHPTKAEEAAANIKKAE